jgi:PAS domain S-box-containing protein
MNVEWWKRACSECPDAIAFVGTDDKFIYINQAWSILTGFSFSQLCGVKTWQEITVLEDVGADQISSKSLKEHCEENNANKEEYYIEKKYIRSDGTTIPVGIYVHRHPPFGQQEGYIVFARMVGSKEYSELKRSYSELKTAVAVLDQTQQGFSDLDKKLDSRFDHILLMTQANAKRIDEIADTTNSLISTLNQGKVTIGGDYSGQDKIGRDKNSVIVILITVLCVIFLGISVFSVETTILRNTE